MIYKIYKKSFEVLNTNYRQYMQYEPIKDEITVQNRGHIDYVY